MRKVAGLSSIAISMTLGALALLPTTASAAVELPNCDGVVLDTAPALFTGSDSAREASTLPDLPDITLPGVLPPGVDLIDGNALGGEVLCVDVDRPRTPARGARARSERDRRCSNSDTPSYKMRANATRAAVLCLVNKARGRRDKHPLKPSKALLAAAKNHSQEMVAAACFSHQCSGEPPLTSRVTNTGYLPCDCNWRIGENLAYGAGRLSSPRSIVDAWMKSPPHKELILSDFKNGDIGIHDGVPGGGKGGTFTLDFGLKK